MPVGPVTARRLAVIAIGIPRISANSCAVRGRSAGTLPMPANIASSTSTGTALRTMRMLGTCSIACRAMIAIEFLPMNGGSPASISYSTHARL